MRASLQLSLALSLASILSTAHAIPQPVRQRSPYSVVPVDGGAAAAAQTGGLPSPGTIIFTETETVTEKSPAATITIIDVQPQSASTVTVTKTASREEGVEQAKETIYVTVEVVPTAIQSGGAGPVIYAPTTVREVETVLVTLPAAAVTLGGLSSSTRTAESTSSSLSSTSKSSSTRSSGASTASFTASPSKTSTFSSRTSSSTSSSKSSSTSLTAVSTSAAQIVETTSSSSSSSSTTKSYDNGLWKTTYPPWSNSTAPTPPARRIRL